MANSIIRIKRTSTTAIATGTLAIGELGYSSIAGTQSNTGDRLYIGLGLADASTSPIAIGGKYFTDMLSHVPGTLTANAALVVDANSKIDLINVGKLTITGNTGVISSTNTNGNITLTPNGDGYVVISGTNGLVIPVGTTAQQGPSVTGAIRYNTTTAAFEGYSSGNWASLGGVRSVDGLTYILAETSPGNSDDTLHFYASNDTVAVEVATLDTTAYKLKVNTGNNGTATSGALQVAGGAGIAENLFVGGTLSVVGLSTFTDLATFDNGVTISGNATAATEYFRITNGTDTTFLVDTSTGATTIGSSLAIGNDTTVGGNFAVAVNKFTVAAATGNTAVAGTFNVTGATTLSSTFGVTGAATLSSTLAVTGNVSVATNKFTVAAATGNTAIAGTLEVAGVTSLSGNLAINTDKFTVAATTGNTVIAGTLNLTGQLTAGAVSATSGAFSGDLSVATNKFTVASATGNTAVAGTLSTVGNFAINTDKFTVAATTGNTTIAGSLTVSGATSVNGNLALNNYKVTGVSDPTAPQDVATKSYVDSMAQGLHTHSAVDFVTTVPIAVATTYTAGPATAPNLGDPGPGAYLTFASSPTFTYYNASISDYEIATFTNHPQSRVLVIGQTDKTQNGIYVWSTATTFVRAIDADASYAYNGFTALLSNSLNTLTLTTGTTTNLAVGMPIYKVGGNGAPAANSYIVSIDSPTTLTLSTNHQTSGTTNLAFGYGDLGGGDYVFVSDSGYGYVQSTEGVIFGTTNIEWTQFAGQGSWLAGDGLTLTGNSFSVNTANGIEVNAGNVQLKSSVAGNGLSLASGVLTVGGTANRITSSGSSIDIASTYVGQTSITTLGTIGTGEWKGTVISSAYGGTGFTGYTKGDILYASDTNTLSKLPKGIDGQVLMMNSGLPSWTELDGGTF